MTIFQDLQGPSCRRDISIARPRHTKTCVESQSCLETSSSGWLFRAVRTNAEFCGSGDFPKREAIGVPCRVLKKVISRIFMSTVKKYRTNKPFRLTAKAINCSRVRCFIMAARYHFIKTGNVSSSHIKK